MGKQKNKSGAASKADQARELREAAAAAKKKPPVLALVEEKIDHSDKEPELNDEADAEDDVEEDDEDEVSGTPEEKAAKKNLAKELGPARLRAYQFRRIDSRMEKLVKRMLGWGEEAQLKTARAFIKDAQDALVNAATALESLPKEWKPAGAKGERASAVKLTVGTWVNVREKSKKGYESLTDSADFLNNPMKVLQIGKKVVVQTKAGNRLIFPRGELVLVEEKKEAAE